MEKAVQVYVKSTKTWKKNTETQTVISSLEVKSVGTQCGGEKHDSYNREEKLKHWTYDRLRDEVLRSKEEIIQWCMDEGLIAKSRLCCHCDQPMKLVKCEDRSDKHKWECRKSVNGKRHQVEISIRKGSWFEKSNMILEEVLKFTYRWCRDVTQEEIRHELNIATHTAVDWDSFCRETCEVTLMAREHPIGGPGKIVQIDESKFGKRKYHHGHRVEGQWVFGGIEEESRRSFMVAVEKRDESTLLPIIERHIAKGSIIVSDCWKAYINLEKHGYEHRLVNHSKEFVNNDGDHTNKIEGHWRQVKCKMPSFGVRKIAFSSYLAGFLWRYEHKGKDLFSMFLWDVKKIYCEF
jgi:transposase-like protein